MTGTGSVALRIEPSNSASTHPSGVARTITPAINPVETIRHRQQQHTHHVLTEGPGIELERRLEDQRGQEDEEGHVRRDAKVAEGSENFPSEAGDLSQRHTGHDQPDRERNCDTGRGKRNSDPLGKGHHTRGHEQQADRGPNNPDYVTTTLIYT